MGTQVYTNITRLVNTSDRTRLLRGNELSDLPLIEDAYMIIEDGIIAGLGKAKDCPFIRESISLPELTTVLPCWCDSHTHLVFSGSREGEFIGRLKGLSYADIAARGGGILASARKLNDTSDDALFDQAWTRLQELVRLGTGAIEIKSGYGLTLEGELKMLKVIKKLKEKSPVAIKSTLLAAHAVPVEYRDNRTAYIQMIIRDMLPIVAREDLADYVDVFCEEGFYSAEEMGIVCRAAAAYGLRSRLHVNQLSSVGGIEAGISVDALSMDHLEKLTGREIKLLGNYTGAATLLPTAAFFLRSQMPPARQLIDAGAAVTLASDFNPGSSPSGNMNFVISLACIQLRMLPEEAINAATINGASSMEIGADYGSIAVGKKANLIFTKPIPSLAYLPYAFGSNLIDRVMIKGEFI